MELSNYIYKRLIPARDTVKALEIIKTKYPNARIITYRFKNHIYKLSKEDRHKEYQNREMWVWFVKDLNKLIEVI